MVLHMNSPIDAFRYVSQFKFLNTWFHKFEFSLTKTKKDNSALVLSSA